MLPGLFNISFRTGGPGARGRGGQPTMGISREGPGGPTTNISMQGRGMEASDISKIILWNPEEAEKIGLVLDAQPRAMMINTLFAKNIPGRDYYAINEITKSKDTQKSLTAGKTCIITRNYHDKVRNIVDNEDPGICKQ